MIGNIKDNKGNLIKDTRVGSTNTFIAKNNLKLGENVFIGQYNFIEASNGIKIGKGCQITNFISLTSHSSHISIRLYGDQYNKIKDPKGYVKGSIEIGDYTFIGPHSTIMPSSKIGKGCIVSAYSLVNGEFPDFSIIRGIPAKVVGSTKDLDAEFLEDPQIKKMYDSWVNKN